MTPNPHPEPVEGRGFGHSLANSSLVFKQAGYRVFFYSNEGNPRDPVHVHVRRGSAEAKLWLSSEPVIAQSQGFSAKEQNAIVAMIQDSKTEIERAWHAHFGK